MGPPKQSSQVGQPARDSCNMYVRMSQLKKIYKPSSVRGAYTELVQCRHKHIYIYTRVYIRTYVYNIYIDVGYLYMSMGKFTLVTFEWIVLFRKRAYSKPTTILY